ncbi:MAG TPA: HsdR family type I site-specific deoxyribonuclease [Ignavibacteriaceae bacterium]|nr:HsdR family type I site-specific deoxyribonuclease [Ignavibacteriaceae bacterium]
MNILNENKIEYFAIEQLNLLGWEYIHGSVISPEGEKPERASYEQIILTDRLRKAVSVINPHIPQEAQEQAIQKILRIYSPDLLHNNETFHEYLVEKVKIPYQQDGFESSYEVALIDFDNIENNQFLVVNQFTIVENNVNKRPDILLFVNGIPLVVIELKNPADENATTESAFNQIQTYKALIPGLFTYNAICIISDGLECKAGSVSAGSKRYMAWKSAEGVKEASRFTPQLETLIKGMLNPKTLLDITRNFIVFQKTKKEDPKTGITQVNTEKILAAYHQYYAVNKAIESTIRATGLQPSLSPSQRERNKTEMERNKTESERNYRGGFRFSGLVEKARELRRHQTKAEEIFWQLVKSRKFINLKFRRQHQIGPYIVDFYCDEYKLIIEFDGGIHDTTDQQKHDSKRDKYLTSLGNRVLRFKNEELLNNPESVLKTITSSIPLPMGEERGEGYTTSDKRAGVIWHTQGSGKSLSMVFYAGKLITAPAMQNPTIVVITDRNDLDDQLFDTFAASMQLLRQEPVQAESREHLKKLLRVASGGIVFTTIQKFLPEVGKEEYDQLSDRRNIIVIADEAHRTQYGFEASLKDVKDKESKEVIGQRIAYGFAKYMRDALPNATYIGFTGTPIEGTDINTPQVFGNYVDIYDIAKSVEDGSTVKIYYESRLAKVNLDEEGRQLLEELDKELERDEEITEKEKAKAKWSKLEAIVGNKKRIKNLAKDIVDHFEKRQQVFDGKAMIVAMSRRIAVELFDEIIALRPEWRNEDLAKGTIKVVMTAASSDGPIMAKHHTTKQQRRDLSDRMKDPADPLRIVIVIDMWLTGFDVPCLHTMYIDKPMRGHSLMQAIARVNRVFKDKPGGLVVDYLGIATDLKKALSFYSDSGGKGDPTEDITAAIEVMMEKLEIVQQMFNEESKTQKDILVEEPTAYSKGQFRFNYNRFFTGTPNEKLSIILQAEEHILGLKDGKQRFIREVTLLSQAFSLSMPHPQAMEIKEEVAFFQAVKARLVKFDGVDGKGRSAADIDTAIKMIVDQAISSDKVIDIFEAAGIEKPDLSILSDEFLMEVQGMTHKNLAIELLKKILNDEIKSRLRTNLVKSKKFLEMLETAIKKYQNNLLTTAQIIEELIRIAKEVKSSDDDAKRLGLSEAELAFYDALETNDSAVKVLGDEILKTIAREIADKVKKNATIDWTIRESARAKLMVLVKRTLTKYGYPPDKQQKAIDTVLKQAELIADELVK